MLIACRASLFLSVAAAPAAAPAVHAFAYSLVDAVGIGINHDGVALRQAVHAQLALVVSGRLVASRHVAIPAVKEAWLDGEVEYHILLAIVLLGALRKLGGFVIGLDVLHGLGRQLLHQLVATKHALAIHRQADGLAVPRHLAFFVYLDAR